MTSNDGLQKNPEGDCCNKPQDTQDKQAPGYENDTPNNWLRGNGMKPGFDTHKAGR